jgi:predicted dehydrogenase
MKAAIVGVGFMGWIHYLAYQRSESVELAAIVSRDPKKRSGDWRDISGNFGPPGAQVDLSNVRQYASLEQALADPEIDFVDICLPPHLHTSAVQSALSAGKHVFCEKPLAITAVDCQKLVVAAEQHQRQLLVGHVLPYFPEYQFARQVIASGEYGKLLGGTFKRVISDPTWLTDFYDPQRVGGPLIDLHVHDAHLIRMLFGMPRQVTCQGRLKGEVVAYCSSTFGFDDPDLVVSAVSGVINQQGRPFTHGFEIHLEQATLQFELAVLAGEAESMPLKVFTADGKVLRPELAGGDEISGFVLEIDEVARSISSGQPSQILSGQLARDAIIICHKQTESARNHGAVVPIN